LWDDARISEGLTGTPTETLRLDVSRAIAALPTHYRDVLVLRHIHELTIGEVAARTGLTSANVKSRLHHARQLTREYLVQ
jgi:RNA polymerase sigma factor (sigma-70 family)